MKKLYILLALLSVIHIHAQQKVAERVNELVSQNKAFRTFGPFSRINTLMPDTAVKNATYAISNNEQINAIAQAGYETIELAIPYGEQDIIVQLYKADIYAEGFHVDTDKQRNIAYNKGAHYRGIIKGDTSSLVSFNFFENEMNGIISNAMLSNLVIGKLVKKDNENEYIIYSDANLTVTNNYACSTPDPDASQILHREVQGVQSTRCVTMYFEIDYNLYQQNGSNTTTTSNWMTSVYNNVQTLYTNDGISTALKSVYIWTTPDPYSGTSSSDYLYGFNDQRPVFDGDLGQLVGIEPGGLGGVAVSIGGICSESNFSYSDVDFNFSTVPSFSWTVQVITHELGHLMGSPHTHGCYWNGNNTAIDGCGSSQGYVEGNCAQGPIPNANIRGTIMSYCHLVPGNGINFANGFGPQPKARILNHVNSSFCLSFDCINTCVNTVADFAVNTTLTSAAFTWTDPNNSGPWQVAVVPLSSGFSGWQDVAVNSYSVVGLTADTCYKIGIRPLCPTGVFTEIREFIFCTDSDFCAGYIFYDTGGVSGNYANDQYLKRTFKPGTANTRIKIVFNSFNTEADFDYLYVYDGPDTNAPLLGRYSGLTQPGTFQSTAADGSLTIKFTSDSAQIRSGWKATISCIAALGTDDTAFTEFSYYPNPSNGIINISSQDEMSEVAVYNVAGQLLLTNKINAAETAVNISSFANGVYFFKVTNGRKEANFRIIKQ